MTSCCTNGHVQFFLSNQMLSRMYGASKVTFAERKKKLRHSYMHEKLIHVQNKQNKKTPIDMLPVKSLGYFGFF